MIQFLGSYGAFGNQGGSFGNRMDSHRGGSNADRDNRVSDQMHVNFILQKIYYRRMILRMKIAILAKIWPVPPPNFALFMSIFANKSAVLNTQYCMVQNNAFPKAIFP